MSVFPEELLGGKSHTDDTSYKIKERKKKRVKGREKGKCVQCC